MKYFVIPVSLILYLLTACSVAGKPCDRVDQYRFRPALEEIDISKTDNLPYLDFYFSPSTEKFLKFHSNIEEKVFISSTRSIEGDYNFVPSQRASSVVGVNISSENPLRIRIPLTVSYNAANEYLLNFGKLGRIRLKSGGVAWINLNLFVAEGCDIDSSYEGFFSDGLKIVT
ncbi:MAG: hypothetical protein AAFW83_11770 [Pseudomonadota bacterium]